MRGLAAFAAGFAAGALTLWLVTTGRAPSLPPAAAPPVAASGPPSLEPSPLAPTTAAPGPGTPFGGAPSAASPLGGLPEPSAAPAMTPSPWAPPPDAAAPLGIRTPSPVPGDSTDALLQPREMVAPADAPRLNLPSVTDLDRLRGRQLLVPVRGFDVHQLRDNFAEKRGARVHEAIDMPAGRGTPVLAVDDGTVRKLFTSVPGGLTVYLFDPSATFAYYYAHLDAYAPGLREGQTVKKGDVLGTVGATGNAPPGVPHLHFTIFKLDPEKRWWQGTPINPYPLWALR
jgi:murein DD-endopeptidase MepM/ murein hydrolase activator NlpD